MVKLERFSIELEQPDAVFSPGDRVNGRLCLQLSELIKINTLKLKMKGEAFVHW